MWYNLKKIKAYMLITRASEYALLSLILLAKATRPLDVSTLSKELNISKSFLAKILQSMAREGLLRSYRGASGGFEIAKKLDQITVHHIMLCVEGKSVAVFDCSLDESDCPSDKASTCTIWPIINSLQKRIDGFLSSVTLEDMLKNDNRKKRD